MSYTCVLVNRTLARFVALFFLFSAAFDICHPCAEKLESVGLLPDHAGFDWDHSPDKTDSSVAVRPNGARQQQPKSQSRPVDDDCFCCNGRLLVLTPFLPAKPLDVWSSVQNRVPMQGLEGFLRYHNYHPPPLRLAPTHLAIQVPERGSGRLEILLSADLLSPPACRRAAYA